MKKIVAALSVLLIMSALLLSCKKEGQKIGYDYDAIPDEEVSPNGKYEIAFVTDGGALKDNSFNQRTWEGLKRYAWENGKTYKYYQPPLKGDPTDEDRYLAIKEAADGGAELVICIGPNQKYALQKAAMDFPQIKFAWIDGQTLTETENKNQKLSNVAAIDFQEEQLGYLAGYAVVMAGYTRLGFSSDSEDPACCRLCYGYIQGAEAAAAVKGQKAEIRYRYGKTSDSNLTASGELQGILRGWCRSGTEVIFVSGGLSYEAALSIASDETKIIAADADGEAEAVILSTAKGLREAVLYICGKFCEGKWDEVGGIQTTLGAAENAVGLQEMSRKWTDFSIEDYQALLASMKSGETAVSRDYNSGLANQIFSHVQVESVE